MIVTRRLVLRKLTLNDVKPLASLIDAHAQNMMNIEGGDWRKPRQFHNRVSSMVKCRYTYVIERKGEIIGEVSIIPVPGITTKLDAHYLGFWLSKKYRGHGYAEEAARAALKKFDVEVGGIIKAGCFVENTASYRILDKLGFIKVRDDEVWSPVLGEYKDACWFMR